MRKKYIITGMLIFIAVAAGTLFFSKIFYRGETPEMGNPEKPNISSESPDIEISVKYKGFDALEAFLSHEAIEEIKDRLELLAVEDMSYVYLEKQDYFIQEGICFYIWGDNAVYKVVYNIRNQKLFYTPVEVTNEGIEEKREASYVIYHRYPSDFDYRLLYTKNAPEKIEKLFETTEVLFICTLADYLGENDETVAIEIKEYQVNPTNDSNVGFNIELTDKNGEKSILTTVFNNSRYEFRELNDNYLLYFSNSAVEKGIEWEEIGKANDMLAGESE